MADQRRAGDAGRFGWLGSDMIQDERWIHRFSQEELDELDRALGVFNATGKSVEEMTREDFPLPLFASKAVGHVAELRDGRGFVVLRGLPVAGYSDADSGAIFYGLGLYLGRPLYQNPQGDLLGHVYDRGRKFGAKDVRGSLTNAYLPFHTDSCEIVGLLCLRAAKSGGASSLCSSVAVFREIADKHPEYLEPLRRGYPYILREAAATNSAITTPPVPVYDSIDGVVSCRFIPTQIEAAAQVAGRPLAGLERAAFDEVLKLSASAPFRLDMQLQQGDIQLVNNYTVLHSRTEYEDWPEAERRRHMVRLWLAFDDAWPLQQGFARPLGYRKGAGVDLGIAA